MVKRWVMSIGLLFCVFLLTSAISTAAEPLKIAVVDSRKCIEQCEAGKKISADLKEKFDRTRKDLDARRNEIIKMQEDLSNKSNLLSAEAKREKEKDLLRKEEDLRDLAQGKEIEFQKEESKAFQNISNELFEVASKIARDEGYTLILEVKSGVVYNNSDIDITDRVIKSYNEKKAKTR